MPAKDAITTMAVGDVLLTRASPPSIFKGVRDVLQEADLLLGNQEGPVTDRGEPLLGKVESGSVCLRGSVRAAEAEAEAGFSAMSLANNHIMDFGAQGLFQTTKLLNQHGIAYAGAGGSLEEARQPALLRRDGTRIAMLGYTTVFPVAGYAAGKDRPGVATVRVHTAYQTPHNVPYQPATPAITVATPDPQDMEQMLADIRLARRGADVVVVQYHWGVAGYPRAVGYIKEKGRAAVDAGADLVLGNHPHLLLGFELYNGKLICYSLNHFAFDIRTPWPGGTESVVLKSVIRDGRFERHSVVPISIDAKTRDLEVARGQRQAAIQKTLEGLSHEFGTGFKVEGDELVLTGPAPGTQPPLRGPAVLADAPLTDPSFYRGT